MAFNREEVKAIRDELQKLVDEFCESKDITVTVGNATYSDTEINFKVNVIRSGEDSARDRWVENCKYLGLSADDFGKRIVLNGEWFTAIGLKPKARKNCIIVRRDIGGKEYVISRDTFIRKGGTDAWAVN